jgi:hypothetical protein
MKRLMAVGALAVIFAFLIATPIYHPFVVTDADRFAAWRNGAANSDVAAIEAYLDREGVGDILPLAEILRSDARWRRCPKVEPFAVAPRAMWAAIVPTLRYIRDEVVPAVGPVRVVSGYRDPVANICFRGARASRHRHFAALDLEPEDKVDRATLIAKLCPLHVRTGAAKRVGLGIYAKTRFHIDTAGFRRWGGDYRASSSPCR